MSFSSADAWNENISGLSEQGKSSLLFRQMNSKSPEFALSARPRVPQPGRPIFLDLTIG
jgi:hypothetical protein